jgi:hypothetical protein
VTVTPPEYSLVITSKKEQHMKKYRIAVFSKEEYRAYLNEAAEKRAKRHPLNGTWTLEELREKNAAFRNRPEGWEPRIAQNYLDQIDLYPPDQGLFVQVQEIIEIDE